MNNEDIKVLEEKEKSVLKTFKEGYGLTNAEREILLNLIENLINRNKELEEENKKLHIDNEIRQLYENEMLGYMKGYENGRMGATGLAHKVGKEFVDYLLSTKLSQYKEDYIKARKLLDDSIPKSKVREKIEILEKHKQNIKPNTLDTAYKQAYCDGGIDSLNEIL